MTASKKNAARRTKKPAGTGKSPTRSRSLVSKAPKIRTGPAAFSNESALNFLQSRLGALSRSRDEATGAMAEGLGKFADSIGLRKLEDVFDQRVASALERMGIPTARELAKLREQVDALSKQVSELKSRQKK